MKHFDSKAYYLAHRSEILERQKRNYWSNHDSELERQKRQRGSHCEVYRERYRERFKRWRGSHRKAHRAIRLAQACIPLGSCCEFCGSVDGLMRFHPDYDFPKIVVTVCRKCRSWVFSSKAL